LHVAVETVAVAVVFVVVVIVCLVAAVSAVLFQHGRFPGATNGEGTCYEDDAKTDAYLAGATADTTFSYSRFQFRHAS
jgi:hypothetical protein